MKEKAPQVNNFIPILLLFCLILLYTCSDLTNNSTTKIDDGTALTEQVLIEPFNLRAKRVGGQRPYRYYVAFSTLNEEGTYTHHEVSLKVPQFWATKAKQMDRLVHYKMLIEDGPATAQRYNGKVIAREVNAVLPDIDEAFEWLRSETKKFDEKSWMSLTVGAQSTSGKVQNEKTLDYAFVTECQVYGTCRGTISNPMAECWETVTNNCVTYMVQIEETLRQAEPDPTSDSPKGGGSPTGNGKDSNPCNREDLAHAIECLDRPDVEENEPEKPCIGNPIKNPKIAAQKNSGVNGGRFGHIQSGGKQFHNGLDLKNDYGNPIFAPYNGKIVSIGEDKDFGNYITLQFLFTDGMYYSMQFSHLQKEWPIPNGGNVKAGDVIGYQGDSGNLAIAIKYGLTTSHVHIVARVRSTSSWSIGTYELVNPEILIQTKFDSNGNVNNDTSC